MRGFVGVIVIVGGASCEGVKDLGCRGGSVRLLGFGGFWGKDMIGLVVVGYWIKGRARVERKGNGGNLGICLFVFVYYLEASCFFGALVFRYVFVWVNDGSV